MSIRKPLIILSILSLSLAVVTAAFAAGRPSSSVDGFITWQNKASGNRVMVKAYISTDAHPGNITNVAACWEGTAKCVKLVVLNYIVERRTSHAKPMAVRLPGDITNYRGALPVTSTIGSKHKFMLYYKVDGYSFSKAVMDKIDSKETKLPPNSGAGGDK